MAGVWGLVFFKYRTVRYLGRNGSVKERKSMRILMIISVLAGLSLGFREGMAGDATLLFDGTNYVALRTVFTNRVETFTNTSGKAFVGVRVESIGTEGLTWWGTNGFSGGRVPLAELSPETRERLAIPAALVNFKATSDAEKREAKLRAYLDQADRNRDELAKRSESEFKTKLDALIARLEQAGVFAGWTRNGSVVRLKVGIPFSALDFEDKKAAVQAVFAQAGGSAGGVELIRLMDRFSNKQIGIFSRFGLEMD